MFFIPAFQTGAYLLDWFNAILGAKYAKVMDHVISEK
jgi:hypothetical protein